MALIDQQGFIDDGTENLYVDGNLTIGGNIICTPNVVVANNTGSIGPANPLAWPAPAITRQGSGIFLIESNWCPILSSGESVVVTAQLFRDATQLPPIRKAVPADSGQNIMLAISYLDTVTDYNPHVYSVQVTNNSSIPMTDGQNHAVILVAEQ